MHNHLDHISLTLLPLLFLLLYQFTQRKTFSLKNTIVLLFISLFVFLHAVPSVPILTSHHQQQFAGEYHPCCMPQLSEPTQIIVFQTHEILGDYIPEVKSVTAQQSFLYATNNRSPPFI